jgi:thiopeptide-type bacteriocin biosynthesis protein
VYCGEAAADGVLLEHLAPLARAAVERGDADRWFFIRYVDPAPHLRLRLHGDPRRLAAKALPALQAALEPLRARGAIWKVELGTYEPEVERYGGPEAIEACERIFHRDSEAVVALLEEAAGDPEARWRFALWGLRALLRDFGLSPPEQLDLLRRERAFRASIVPASLKLDAQLAARYRRGREEIAAALEEAEPPAVRARSEAIRLDVLALRWTKLQRPVASIAADVLHMHANRMFHAAAQHQELVLYDFLVRDAVSRQKREGK